MELLNFGYKNQKDSLFSNLIITCKCGYKTKFDKIKIDGVIGFTCQKCESKFTMYMRPVFGIMGSPRIIIRERQNDDFINEYKQSRNNWKKIIFKCLMHGSN